MADQRLTWNQIRKLYPDQWVALTDVIYMDDDGMFTKGLNLQC